MNFLKPFIVIITLLLLFSCKQKKTVDALFIKDIDVNIPQQIKPASTIVFDSSFQKIFFATYPQLSTIQKEWINFYQNRKYSFAWVDSSGLTVAAQNLHNRINNLQNDGLNDSLIYRKEFNHLFEDAITITTADTKDSTLINAEMMLTAQYFLYAKQIYSSIDASDLKKLGWNMTQSKINYEEYLINSLENKKDIFENEPVFFQYALLRKYLIQYKDIESKGGFPKMDSSIKNILPNDSNKSMPKIKQYLTLVGDLKTNDNTLLFDNTTVTAIKQFRVRHGLKDTALIDKLVVKEMNVPVAKRIEKILINMERCKWMPHNPSENYLLVNIPDFSLSIYEKNLLQFKMKVVVGALATKTVIFNEELTTIAFSPYWNVPYSIFKKELSNKSASYLRRNNMEYVGSSSIRQLPGGNNALGKVKFLFPNNYNIYLHDTPAKDRFNYAQRAFSHGCIRISEPKKLAQYLLRNEPVYTEKIIDSLMNQRKETQVKLKNKVEVFIGYFTSFVNNENGLLQFRNDIYNNDNKVLEYFEKK